MEQVDLKFWPLSRAPSGPLAAYIDPFTEYLDRQGYKRSVIGSQLQFIDRFSRWLNAKHIGIGSLTDDQAQQFLAKFKSAISGGLSSAIYRFIAFLRQLGIIKNVRDVPELTQAQQIVDAYSHYLSADQGLSCKTSIQYTAFIEQFLAGKFGAGPIGLSALCAADAISFIRQQAARLSPARARCATIALRSFLRYLRFCGEITLDLAAGVPAVPNWSMTAIPRAISAVHLQAVLASCKRDTPTGRRDYAILMLLARLGLRSSEIATLTLDSIDWGTSSLVISGKGGIQSTLPIPAVVGEAIADYLQRGRPRCACRALFLRALAPIRGFGAPSSIASVVYAAIARAGIETPHRGTHQFRHALACEMLRHRATLPEIGSILRHQHSKTTGIYAKVDFAALRPLGLAWPGDIK